MNTIIFDVDPVNPHNGAINARELTDDEEERLDKAFEELFGDEFYESLVNTPYSDEIVLRKFYEGEYAHIIQRYYT